MNKNDDDNELFLQNNWLVKGFKPYFKSGQQSEILTIANLTCHEQKSEAVQNVSSACVEEKFKNQYQWICNIQIIWIEFWWGVRGFF